MSHCQQWQSGSGVGGGELEREIYCLHFRSSLAELVTLLAQIQLLFSISKILLPQLVPMGRHSVWHPHIRGARWGETCGKSTRFKGPFMSSRARSLGTRHTASSRISTSLLQISISNGFISRQYVARSSGRRMEQTKK
jgi:hypothetical protein